MTSSLNLASKPFTNRTLPWVISALVLFLSLVTLVAILRSASRANTQAAGIQNEIRTLRREEEGLRKKAEAVQASLSREQLQTLSAAHALIDRKHFSWSRLFMDLESALPGTVRVSRIAVRDVAATTDQTVAELELAVVAKSSVTITEMIEEMDRNGVFQAELRSQNLQKGRGESGTEYELSVLYRPRQSAPARDSQASSKSSSAVDLASAGDNR